MCLMEWKNSSSTVMAKVCSFSVVKLNGVFSTFFLMNLAWSDSTFTCVIRE